MIAPAPAAERPASGTGTGEEDFFAPLDAPQHLGTRPVITQDDTFATPLGPPPEPELPEAAQTRPAKAQQAEQFGVACGLCGTRIYATRDQVGQELTCPDCHSRIPIRAPKAAPKKPAPASRQPAEDEDDDGTFRLSEPEQRPQSDYLVRAQQTLAGATTVVAGAGTRAADSGPDNQPAKPTAAAASKPAGLDVIAEQARSVLAKAKAEMEEAERAKAKLPDRPFASGMISFLFEVGAITRWVVLTLLLQGGVSVLAVVLAGHYAGALLMMPIAIVSLLFLPTAAICYQAILVDTANGRDTVEQWPGVNFLDWMGETFYVINAFFASATPGVLFGQLLACAGAPTLSAAFFGLVSFFVLFPVLLLSMVEEGSPLSIASSAIWRSLLSARFLWIRFYLFAAGITFTALMGLVLGVVALTATNPVIGFLLCSVPFALTMGATMVYFRLLGRLAWCLSELDRQRA